MLLEGPFETDYSLAIVNRNLASAMLRLGKQVRLHQRDNTTSYAPSFEFLLANPDLACLFVNSVDSTRVDVHSRTMYPPFTDKMVGRVRAVHCYGWEESSFPAQYVEAFNRDLDLITVMSGYVKTVLESNGVTVPIEVAGLGADHVLRAPAVPVRFLRADTFNFVHISSCFPRKAADVIVEAFCREFRRGNDVCLIIKTFPNPHNRIDEIVASARSRYGDHPRIEVVQEPLSPGQIRYLAENAGCLLSPSRGEGFGLPVAEAMLLGCPVIATLHGGLADLCSPEWSWPVEFELQPAQTHLTEGRSYWAEPSVHSLQEQMRAVYRASRQERARRTERAQRHITENFTWEQVGLRHDAACCEILERKRAYALSIAVSGSIHVGFISSWNTKCGIAEYTRYLATNLDHSVAYSVFANRADDRVREDENNAIRCWNPSAEACTKGDLEAMVRHILERGVHLVSLQYNFGFFSPGAVEFLLERLHRHGIGLAITLHSTTHANFTHLAKVLRRADVCVVHQQQDLHNLKAAHVENAVIQPQGIYIPERKQRIEPPGRCPAAFTVASFGFLLPPKGIYDLLQAFQAAVPANPALRLKL
ncbi:MAG: glycosyltransferase, partial [Acidobacteriales bacterium]|nr:glycosyltransferase [Terriglobales bacterium]